MLDGAYCIAILLQKLPKYLFVGTSGFFLVVAGANGSEFCRKNSQEYLILSRFAPSGIVRKLRVSFRPRSVGSGAHFSMSWFGGAHHDRNSNGQYLRELRENCELLFVWSILFSAVGCFPVTAGGFLPRRQEENTRDTKSAL